MELRCEHKKFGELTEDGYIEVKCSSRFCGPLGVVVIHRFDPLTGELIETKRFRDPGPVMGTEEVSSNDNANFAAVRPS